MQSATNQPTHGASTNNHTRIPMRARRTAGIGVTGRMSIQPTVSRDVSEILKRKMPTTKLELKKYKEELKIELKNSQDKKAQDLISTRINIVKSNISKFNSKKEDAPGENKAEKKEKEKTKKHKGEKEEPSAKIKIEKEEKKKRSSIDEESDVIDIDSESQEMKLPHILSDPENAINDLVQIFYKDNELTKNGEELAHLLTEYAGEKSKKMNFEQCLGELFSLWNRLQHAEKKPINDWDKIANLFFTNNGEGKKLTAAGTKMVAILQEEGIRNPVASLWRYNSCATDEASLYLTPFEEMSDFCQNNKELLTAIFPILNFFKDLDFKKFKKINLKTLAENAIEYAEKGEISHQKGVKKKTAKFIENFCKAIAPIIKFTFDFFETVNIREFGDFEEILENPKKFNLLNDLLYCISKFPFKEKLINKLGKHLIPIAIESIELGKEIENFLKIKPSQDTDLFTKTSNPLLKEVLLAAFKKHKVAHFIDLIRSINNFQIAIVEVDQKRKEDFKPEFTDLLENIFELARNLLSEFEKDPVEKRLLEEIKKGMQKVDWTQDTETVLNDAYKEGVALLEGLKK